VVNTFNRADSLALTLDGLGRLDYEEFEIVVVNGPSTDATAAVLETFKGAITVQRCFERNLAASRNIGIRAAAGEIVAFIDDDAYPDPAWLDRLVEAYDDPETGAAGGPVYSHTGAHIQAWRSLVDRFGNSWPEFDPEARRDRYLSRPYSELIPYTIGTNSSFRRHLVVKLGGFDEEFAYYLEESDLCCRIVDAGYVVRQLDDGFVYHKFLPGLVRERREVVKDYFDVLKSKCYFALKHALAQHSFAEVWRDCERFVEACRTDVAKAVEEGLLTAADQEKFDADVHAASTAALEAFRRGRPRTRPPAWFQTRPRQLLRVPGQSKTTAGSSCVGGLTESQRATSDRHVDLGVDRIRARRFPRRLSRDEKLSICLLCQEYPPRRVNGIGRVVHALATGLAGAGHHVDVVTKGKEMLRVDLEDGVWVHRMPVTPQPGAPAGVPQHLWDYSASMRLEVERIHRHRPIDVLQAPNWDSEAVALVGDGRFPVVIALYTPLHTLTRVDPLFSAALEAGDRTLRDMLDLEAELLGRADGLLACGPAIVAEVESAYGVSLASKPLGMVAHGLPDLAGQRHGGVDAAPIGRGRPSPADGTTEGAPGAVGAAADRSVSAGPGGVGVLFVGRLEARKGIDVLLEAAESLVVAHPDVRFTIVGDDALPAAGGTTVRRQFEARAHPAAKARVRFLGPVDDATLVALYEGCDLVVVPSRYESFGLMLLEAMMFAKPVVASAVGGMEEIVVNGETGILVPAGDVGALVEAIDALLRSPQRRVMMGTAGRDRYERHYSQMAMVQGVVAYYRSLARSPR